MLLGLVVRRWSGNREGFSLVEMMAALMIFSVGVVAMIEVFAVCVRSTGTARDYSRAVFLAQALVEEALAEDALSEGEETGEFDQELSDGTWERLITATDDEGLYEVYVTVEWQDRGRQRTFELTTLAAGR